MNQFLGMSPLLAALAVFVAGALAVLGITLWWGMSQWGAKTPHRVGDQMINARITVSEWSGNDGYVYVDGELWRAIADEPLSPGDVVSVAKVDGLILKVTKTEKRETS